MKKHLDVAEKSPKQIAAAVLGLPEKTVRYKPSPDKWCIREILGHLADMEILYAYRLRQMLADQDPVIAPIDQDDWSKNLGYLESSPPELVALYGLNRHAAVRLLRRLKAEDLQKSARHPELDHPVTVGDYVGMMSKHGPNHLHQIERLKKRSDKDLKAETTGHAPAFRHVLDSQQRCRSRSTGLVPGTAKMHSRHSISAMVCSASIPVYNKPIE